MEGLGVRKLNNGFTVTTLHYTADPTKRTEIWRKEAKYGLPEDLFDREYEINYSSSAGKPYYPSFKQSIHCRDLQYIKGKEVLRGWDFGYHHPAVSFSQIDNKDRWIILFEIMGKDITIDNFASRIVTESNTRFPNVIFKDYCDPAGSQKSDKGERSSIEIINRLGIYPKYRARPIMDGVTIIRKKLQIRDDGSPEILIDKNKCPIIVEAFSGGLHYPENDPEDELPEKDGYFEHLMDTLRYVATNVFSIFGNYYNFYNLQPTGCSYSWKTTL